MSTFILNICTVCNQRCVFCLDGDLKPGMNLTLAQVKTQIRVARRKKFDDVLFMGGETTVRKDFDQIVAYVTANGMNTWVATNGLRFAYPEYLRHLIDDAGLYGIEFSLHSHEREVANRLAGMKRSFDLQAAALANIVAYNRTALAAGKRPVKLIFNSVIHAWNHRQIDALVRYIDAQVGGAFEYAVKLKGLRARGRALQNAYILPRYPDLAPSLQAACDFMAGRGVSYFVEGVPLCFLKGHEFASLETDGIVRNYKYGGWNFHSGGHTGLCQDGGLGEGYGRAAGCATCTLPAVCAGVWNDYLRLFGDAEFQPSAVPVDDVARQVLLPSDQRRAQLMAAHAATSLTA